MRLEDLLTPEQVATLSDDQVRAIVARARELKRRIQDEGPQSKEELWWWLNLLRWEFALPERESVAAEAGRLLDYFRAHGASFDGDRRQMPLVNALVDILENFREAYWIAVESAFGNTSHVSRTRRSHCSVAKMKMRT